MEDNDNPSIPPPPPAPAGAPEQPVRKKYAPRRYQGPGMVRKGFAKKEPRPEEGGNVTVKYEPVTADAAGQGDKVFDRQAYVQEVERIRAIRRPFGKFMQKLAIAQRPGYHRHWFNDIPGRIEQAVGAGWTHVKDEKGKALKRVVGSGRDRTGALYAYCMEIPLVFWEEDQAAKREAARRPIEAIKSSPFKAKPGQSTPADKEKFYSPKEEVVKINTITE